MEGTVAAALRADSGDVIDALDTAAQGASKFIENYYERYDKHRSQVGQFYHAEAVLLWNGNVVVTKGEIESYLQRLPTSRHTISAFDCQPVIASGAPPFPLLVNVSGVAQFGDAASKPFSQQFVLMSLNGTPYAVQNDVFRFV